MRTYLSCGCPYASCLGHSMSVPTPQIFITKDLPSILEAEEAGIELGERGERGTHLTPNCYCICHQATSSAPNCKHCAPNPITPLLKDSEEYEKLIIFGWITTVLGIPEKADSTKYNELTDRLYDLQKSAQINLLNQLESRLPEKRNTENYVPMHEEGFNECLSEMHTTITEMKGEL